MNKIGLLKPEEAAKHALANVRAFKAQEAKKAAAARRNPASKLAEKPAVEPTNPDPVLKEKMNSLLMQSAEKGELDEVGRLLKAGADVNTKCDHGWTALMYAAREGHMEVIELLITNGANVNAANSTGWTALDYAAMKKKTRPMKRHKEIADLLKKYGAKE